MTNKELSELLIQSIESFEADKTLSLKDKELLQNIIEYLGHLHSQNETTETGLAMLEQIKVSSEDMATIVEMTFATHAVKIREEVIKQLRHIAPMLVQARDNHSDFVKLLRQEDVEDDSINQDLSHLEKRFAAFNKDLKID